MFTDNKGLEVPVFMNIIQFSDVASRGGPSPIQDESSRDGVRLDVSVLRRNTPSLRAGLIAPPEEEVEYELAAEHTSEPIKSMDDIFMVSDFLVRNKRWRDNMLFIVGINFGLRVGDLRSLRFSHLINNNLTFKDRFAVLEQKTKNTRAHRRNRYITINMAVIEAVTLYLENTKDVCLSDYMFRSQSNHGCNSNAPLSRMSFDRILKGIAKDCGLNMKVSTHTLRKTFAYHQMAMSGNDPRKLLLLQKILGHSSVSQTLDYIGITRDEIDEAYREMNLGSRRHNYLIDGDLGEYIAS